MAWESLEQPIRWPDLGAQALMGKTVGRLPAQVLPRLQLPRELELARLIRESGAVGQACRPNKELPTRTAYKMRNHCLVLDASRLKDISQKLGTFLRTFGLSTELEVTLIPEPGYNAFLFPVPGGQGFVLGIHTGLLEAFSTEEILFVLGHELGHQMLGHLSTNAEIRDQLRGLHPTCLLSLQAHGMFRRQELSADRFGLLCCGALEPAMHAMLKLMTQSPCEGIQASPAELLLEENPDSNAPFVDAAFDGLEPWLFTHPIPRIRAQAMARFARALGCLSMEGLRNVHPGTLEAANEACEAQLDCLEADSLKSDREGVLRLHRIVLEMAMVVAMADGNLTEAESDLIAKIAARVASEKKDRVHNISLRANSLERDLPSEADLLFLRKVTSPGRRLRIFSLLVSVAQQDMRMGSKEMSCLRRFGQQIGLPKTTVDTHVHRAKQMVHLWQIGKPLPNTLVTTLP